MEFGDSRWRRLGWEANREMVKSSRGPRFVGAKIKQWILVQSGGHSCGDVVDDVPEAVDLQAAGVFHVCPRIPDGRRDHGHTDAILMRMAGSFPKYLIPCHLPGLIRAVGDSRSKIGAIRRAI